MIDEIPESYLMLNTSPPRATRDGDSMQWYMAKFKEKGLYPELPC